LVKLANGNALIYGGEWHNSGSAALPLATAYVWNRDAGTWAQDWTMSTARMLPNQNQYPASGSGLRLSDGRVITMGGENPQGTRIASTDLYQPVGTYTANVVRDSCDGGAGAPLLNGLMTYYSFNSTTADLADAGDDFTYDFTSTLSGAAYSNTAPVITQGQTGPDGGVTAIKVDFPATGGGQQTQLVRYTVGPAANIGLGPYYFDIDLKAASGTPTICLWNQVSTSTYGGLITLSTSWQHFTVTGTTEPVEQMVSQLGYNAYSLNNVCGGAAYSATTVYVSGAKLSMHNRNWVGTNITYAAGKIGDAAVFNGSSAWIGVPNTLNFMLPAFSYSMWVKAAAVGPRALFQAQYDISIVPTESGWLTHLNSGDRTISALQPDGGVILSSTGSVGTNAYSHVVYTSTAGSQKLYINGTLTASGLDATTAYEAYFGRTRLGVSEAAAASRGEYFNGQLDEFGYWNRVLSQTEVTILYNSGAGLAYPFDN
jgi:hypothetical protein